MKLSEKQQLFTVMIASLIHFAQEKGYRLTFGEAYRTPEQAALNAKKGSGITNSLHTQRLAVDFNLFINGEYQTDSAAIGLDNCVEVIKKVIELKFGVKCPQ